MKLALLLLLSSLASASAASPASPASPVQPTATDVSVEERILRAEAAMESLEYDVAADELMIAIGDPAATEEQLVRANLLAGVAQRILDRNVEARLHFHYVLSQAPATDLPADTAPKIRSFYELVRKEVEAASPAASSSAVPSSTAPPSTAPSSSAPSDPEPAPASLLSAGLLYGGLVVVGVAAPAALFALGGAGLAEILVTDAAADGQSRADLLVLGRAALVLAAAFALFVGAGASAAVAGLVVE